MPDFNAIAFSPSHDEVISPIVMSLHEAWTLASGRTQNTLGGNDTISGGLVNRGTCLTGRGNDVISAPGYRGLVNYETGIILTESGNDFIIINRVSDSNNDIKNYGLIDLGVGDDNISISGDSTPGIGPLSGLHNFAGGQFFTGKGMDTITVRGRGTRFRNEGLFDTGEHSDTIICDQFLDNPGQILTGSGHDVISVTSPVSLTSYAIFNEGTINAGIGNDTLTGSNTDVGFFPLLTTGISNSGTILLEKGNDHLNGIGGNVGISNGGLINSGDGNDVITGQGATKAIENWGTILTGSGRDTVNALEGGFGGLGTLNLGIGNDTLLGFGTGTFEGGLGTDVLTFRPGTYTIAATAGGAHQITNAGLQMTVLGFERFGAGANLTLFSQAVLAGQVTFS
jgi:hypothetical protein